MRLFGGERLQGLMDKLKIDDDTPIEAGMVSNSIESAQRKVESRNFAIRKNVLQYDEVMNSQRQIIYSQRDQVLNGENMKEQIQKMVYGAIEHNVKQYLPESVPHEEWDMICLLYTSLGWGSAWLWRRKTSAGSGAPPPGRKGGTLVWRTDF